MRAVYRLRMLAERLGSLPSSWNMGAVSTRPRKRESFAKPGSLASVHRMSAPLTVYPLPEERANVITHAVGVALSVAGLLVLLTLSATRGDAWHVIGTGVFGMSLVMLYGISTLYHLSRDPAAKQWWRKCDHAGIFLLIAGSYTPFLLVNLRGPWGWSLFGVVWGLGLAGVVLKFWFAGHFRIISTLIYVALGWLVLIAIRPLLEEVPLPGVWLLVTGGFLYTGGTAFYLWKSLPYHHAVWHVFVLAGSTCHWIAVFRYVVPPA